MTPFCADLRSDGLAVEDADEDGCEEGAAFVVSLAVFLLSRSVLSFSLSLAAANPAAAMSPPYRCSISFTSGISLNGTPLTG